MPVKQISVTEASALQAQGAVYLDVRSTREYVDGHPAGAVNIPLFEPDEDTGEMTPNPDFLRVVQANFPSDTPFLVGCQVGGRSMRAAEVLQAFGYTDLSNVRGGFDGAYDHVSGRLIDKGWVESGLPVEHHAPPGGSYSHLLAKAAPDR